MEVSKILKPYKRPEYYLGETYEGHYVIYSINASSSFLDVSNMECYKRVADSHGILVTFQHYLVGWIECLLIHFDAPKDIIRHLEQLTMNELEYPVLDDDDYSARRHEYINEMWKDLPLKEKIELCVEANISIFSSRGCIPYEVFDILSDEVY